MNFDQFIEMIRDMGKWDFGVSFNRSNPIPLDANSIFTSYADLENYCKGNPPEGYLDNGYPGQVVAVVTEEATDLYVLVYDSDADNNLTPTKLQTALKGDNNSVLIDGTTIKLSGFDKASNKTIPYKDGVKIVWKSVDELINTPLNTLKDAINNEVNPKLEELTTDIGTYADGQNPSTGLRGDLEKTYNTLTSTVDRLKSDIATELGQYSDEENGVVASGLRKDVEDLQEELSVEKTNRESEGNRLQEQIDTLDAAMKENAQTVEDVRERLPSVEEALTDEGGNLISVPEIKNSIENPTDGLRKKVTDLDDAINGVEGVSGRLNKVEEYINGEGEGSLKSEIAKLADISDHVNDNTKHLSWDTIKTYIESCNIVIDGNL